MEVTVNTVWVEEQNRENNKIKRSIGITQKSLVAHGLFLLHVCHDFGDFWN